MRKISAKLGITALSALAVFAISVPLAHSQGGPADFMVNCNQGESIQDALDQASDGNRIKVVGGPCVENIVIKLDHLTLFGNGNPEIDGSGDSASPTVEVLGTNVTITGFTITGGLFGIRVTRGASAVITKDTVENAVRAGIIITESSAAKILDCTVISNGGNGIQVNRSSTADINDCTVGVEFAGNGNDGITARRSSHADIDGSTISFNGDDGVAVSQVSSIDLSPDGDTNFIHDNFDDGVTCGLLSHLNVEEVQDFTGGNGGDNTRIAGGGRCSVSYDPPGCDLDFPLASDCP